MEQKELIKILTKFMNEHVQNKEWMTIKEATAYAGVCFNTFVKFREKGLKVAEIDGTKRVSRKEIDRFLEDHSF